MFKSPIRLFTSILLLPFSSWSYSQATFDPNDGVLHVPSVEIVGSNPLDIYELKLILEGDASFNVIEVVPVTDASSLKHQTIQCANIEIQSARIACFDQLAQNFGYVFNAPPSDNPISEDGTGDWYTSVETNPIDDTTTAALVLIASSGVNEWGDKISLIIRCQSNKTELYFNWHDYLGSEARVTTRIGSEDAETRTWNLSTDDEATFYPGSAVLFIQRLIGQERLVAQTTPYADDPITAIFDIYGLSNAIAPVRQTCGW